MTTVAQLLRATRVGLGPEAVDDVLMRFRDRSGTELSQKKALCEAMIRTEDAWEYQKRCASRPTEALKEIRRRLESELYP